MEKFFTGLTVLELSNVLAGPAVGMFFAELGARVIKVENKNTGGDITRQWKLPAENPHAEISAYYASVNWGKEVHFLDLSTEEAYNQVISWLPSVDIVISNFRADSAGKLKLDASSLSVINPRLIYASVSGFGESSNRPAFDVVLQAESGYLYMNGEKDGKPVKMPVALIDLMAAHQLKEAILIALLKRHQTGKGSHISVSLFESAVASLANQASNWLNTGFIPHRMGTEHPNIAPYGDVFQTSDGKEVVLSIGTDQQFMQLCLVLKIPELADADDFSTNASRVLNRKALCAELKETFAKYSSAEIETTFLENNIPFGFIKNMEEVLQHPLSKSMIISQEEKDGSISKRVKTVAFRIEDVNL